MKKIISVVILVSCFTAHSNELINKAYYSHYLNITFSERSFNLEGMDLQNEKRIDSEYNYRLINEKDSNFMIFGENHENKWLILYNDEIFIAFNEEKAAPVFMGYYKDGAAPPFTAIGSDENIIESTSYLIEGSTHYRGDNLRFLKVDSPWVEGIESWGIGEKIFLPRSSISNLVIVNGFISYKNPGLYSENSRLKTIKVTDSLNSYEKIIALQDTMNPQIIGIGDYINRQITIEIIDVYKGLKYMDTCLAGVFNLL